NDYPGFLRHRIPEAFRPGPIVDLDPKILGEHQGMDSFTIGQRRGLGIAAPHPLYVLEIRAEKNEIVVGRSEDLYKKKFIASDIHLTSIEKVEGPLSLKAKIRYKHREAEAKLIPLDSEKMEVEFRKAQRAITPGQAVVFYDGQVVVGGGLIERVIG
ncbi:MAG: aminomethyltransferase beta-barrel domain-containing protein, partial [Candidatus Aminicenantales bacterium]